MQFSTNNPCGQLRDIAKELNLLAAKMGRPAGAIAGDFERLNALDVRWHDAEMEARRTSVGRGIPFQTMERVLRACYQWEREILQYARADPWTFQPLCFLDSAQVIRRLEELAASWEGVSSGSTETTVLVKAEMSVKPTRMSVDEANKKAMQLVEQMGKVFFRLSIREQAHRIGCSFETWTKTPFYAEAEKKRERTGQQKPTRSRRAVGLTDKVEATTGEGDKDEILNQLVAEQKADAEPSPLDDSDKRKVFCKKKV
jgi:hypothetical protein